MSRFGSASDATYEDIQRMRSIHHSVRETNFTKECANRKAKKEMRTEMTSDRKKRGKKTKTCISSNNECNQKAKESDSLQNTDLSSEMNARDPLVSEVYKFPWDKNKRKIIA
ncbi:hypothetical protein [Psittacid alphaherpesvirus 5]|uniref:Uncharacterized protein n=1 Tax=Psittacid alphaherpesvirus 5 TaxID=2972693 RepID=A0A5P9JR52_9ALPH|nr:hypothetical protein QKU09_gp55 [Psittacid alphaherpesvirus 5]QFU14599.1 hypothetical protein [Psittacid alphaherpesvirus 5]UOO01070.1 hypothetical protein [Psittacid alphaherpesvirus 5]